jgi:hypothetical protein
MQDALKTVLATLADRLDGYEGEIDRVEIRVATPTEYPCRVYVRGQDDFEGEFITVDQ